MTDDDQNINITKKCFLKLEMETDKSMMEMRGIPQEMVRCMENIDKVLK